MRERLLPLPNGYPWRTSTHYDVLRRKHVRRLCWKDLLDTPTK